MKKWAFAVVLLLTLGLATGMADTPVVFSSCVALGGAPLDITPTAGVTCDNVNFFYQFAGTSGLNTATISADGIDISAGTDPAGLAGILVLTFPVSSQSIKFDFTLTGATFDINNYNFGLLVLPDGALNSLETVSGASSVDLTSFPPFVGVTIIPNPTATEFTMSSLSYTAYVPEPGTYTLLGAQLLGLGCVVKLARRRS
jgi:hypothetical protein